MPLHKENKDPEVDAMLWRVRKIIYTSNFVALIPIPAFCFFCLGAIISHQNLFHLVFLLLTFVSFPFIGVIGTIGVNMRDLPQHRPLINRLLRSKDPAYIPVLITALDELGDREDFNNALMRHFESVQYLGFHSIPRWQERKLLGIIARRYFRLRWFTLSDNDMDFTFATIRFLAQTGSPRTWKQFRKIATKSPSSSSQRQIYAEVQSQLQNLRQRN